MTSHIPAEFDFLDPDVNLAALPVAELAELRKSEPIHWVDIPGGAGGFPRKPPLSVNPGSGAVAGCG